MVEGVSGSEWLTMKLKDDGEAKYEVEASKSMNGLLLWVNKTARRETPGYVRELIKTATGSGLSKLAEAEGK